MPTMPPEKTPLPALMAITLSMALWGCFQPLFGWTNPGFEDGTLSGWTTASNAGMITVMSPGPATYCNGGMDNVHGGNYSVQIYSNEGSVNHANYARVEQTDTVVADSTCISVWFSAVVDGYHYTQLGPYAEDAYVLFEILVDGSPVYTQRYSSYDNFTQMLSPGIATWWYLPWTRYYYDMSPYVGQQVTVRYTAYDCNQGGHSCYGFIDDLEWLDCALVPTHTPTLTPTPLFSNTPTDTPTLTHTRTITHTPTWTPTSTPTNTPTHTPTLTNTPFLRIWPIPYDASTAINGTLKCHFMPEGSVLSLYTVSGEVVFKTRETNHWVVWNGYTSKGWPVAPGIYYYIVDLDRKKLLSGVLTVNRGP